MSFCQCEFCCFARTTRKRNLIYLFIFSSFEFTLFIFSFEKVMQLESHIAERNSSKIYGALNGRLVPFIRNVLGKEFSEELIMTVAGILDTNCFEILLMSQNRELGGLFLISLILSHDCIPNTKHYVNDDYQMAFETTGERLTV